MKQNIWMMLLCNLDGTEKNDYFFSYAMECDFIAIGWLQAIRCSASINMHPLFGDWHEYEQYKRLKNIDLYDFLETAFDIRRVKCWKTGANE